MKVTENSESRAHNGIVRQYTEHYGYTFHIRRAVLHLSVGRIIALNYSLLSSVRFNTHNKKQEIMACGDASAYVSLCWL